MEDQIERLAKESYFMTPDMIRFLLVENLALKTLLHKRELLDLEEYKQSQREASEILDKRVNSQINEWKKSHPELVGKINSIQESQSPLTKDDVAVV